MKTNVGKADQFVRILLGFIFIFISLFFLLDGPLKYAGTIGLVLLLTSLLKFCPLYTLFSMNTLEKK